MTTAQDFQATALDGKPVSLKEFGGKVLRSDSRKTIALNIRLSGLAQESKLVSPQVRSGS